MSGSIGRSAAVRRAAVLREMGLGPLWRLRSAGTDAAEEPVLPRSEAAVTVALPPVQARTSTASAPARIVRPALPVQPPPSPPVPVTAPIAFDSPSRSARSARIATLEWDALEAQIHACRECVLCQRRRQAVPGVGDRNARWMLVGEGPGADEDLRGEPFVGQAGKLLDNMLHAIGLKRGEDVYIGNAVKCRPPHNRTPESTELAACLPFLERQIDLVRPRLLIALGRPAAQALLSTEVRIGAARGKLFDHRGTPVIVTYHPAYLLRNPQDKARAWEDLCFARRLMQSFER